MKKIVHRRDMLRAGLALGASLVLPSARACEFFSPTLRVTHPWTRATEPDAKFAVVCMKIDEVTETDRLVGVETPVAAGVELVGGGGGAGVNLLIPAGRETLLSEEGTHLRLLDLQHPLLIARSYPLTLVFEKGGIVPATLNVDYMAPGFSFAGKRRF
jgi:periplasmic copper chaperone A